MVARRSSRVMATHAEDADLNVDVMRFFAIVALCLFAILPHTEPSTTSRETKNDRIYSGDMGSALTQKVLNASPSVPQAESISAQGLAQQTPPSSTQIVEHTEVHIPSSAIEAPQWEAIHVPSPAADQDSVRFLNAHTFTEAVANGSIMLIYHYHEASFFFDADEAVFKPIANMSLQIFRLAISEIPESFRRLAPLNKESDTVGQWFITLPDRTLNYLIDGQASGVTISILNEWALPIERQNLQPRLR